MTRKVFIQVYADAVAKGRRHSSPDMRMAEIVMARVHDEKRALKMWNRDRSLFVNRDLAELKAEFEAATMGAE